MSFKSQDGNIHSFDVNLNQDNFLLNQDISHYRDYAKEQRDIQQRGGDSSHYRSFAIIPDIVAIDILTKYGIDLHGTDFLTDPGQVRKVKEIIKKDYPDLLTFGHTKKYY